MPFKEKLKPSIDDQRDMLLKQGEELSVHHTLSMNRYAILTPTPYAKNIVEEAMLFGFLLGSLNGSILVQTYGQADLQKSVYEALKKKFGYTDDDIATDIIGG